MAQTWIPVKYGLPKEEAYYLVYIHRNEQSNDPIFDSVLDAHYTGYVYMAYFNARQGGIWHTDADSVYGSDLEKVDTDTEFYISHWMPLPDPPEEC